MFARLRLQWLVCLLLCVPLLVSAADGRKQRRGKKRPPQLNIIIVTFDTARADRFGAYGNSSGITPTVDRLAAEGTVFENCIAPTGTTAPSRATLFTGTYPKTHGVHANGRRLSARVKTLAQAFEREGYQTGAFVSFPYMLTLSRLGRGFGVASAHPGGRLRDVSVQAGSKINELALQWFKALTLSPSTPRFAWIHYFEAHSPYEVNPWSSARLGEYSGKYLAGLDVATFGMGWWIPNPIDLAAVRTLYDGDLFSADAHFGSLLRQLDANKQLRNTIIVVTADHGQALGEHDHAAHGLLWHSILHVPLIIWDSRDRTPRRVQERVGLIDVKATLVELAGLRAGASPQGRSLVPALRGEPLSTRPYFAAVAHGEAPPAEIQEKFYKPYDLGYDVAAYEGSLKVLVGPGGITAFDVDADPGELAPLAQDRATKRWEELAARAIELRLKTDSAPLEADLTPEEKAGLRALGYFD